MVTIKYLDFDTETNLMNESFITNVTSMWLFPTVNALMLLHRTHLTE
jgi:hypothetical protein